jgi:hypothetical protein
MASCTFNPNAGEPIEEPGSCSEAALGYPDVGAPVPEPSADVAEIRLQVGETVSIAPILPIVCVDGASPLYVVAGELPTGLALDPVTGTLGGAISDQVSGEVEAAFTITAFQNSMLEDNARGSMAVELLVTPTTPEISGFFPATSVKRGETIQLSGLYFLDGGGFFAGALEDNEIQFKTTAGPYGDVVTPLAGTATTLDVVVPKDAATGTVKITQGPESSESSATLTIKPFPVVTSFFPLVFRDPTGQAAAGHSIVTLFGSGFHGTAAQNEVRAADAPFSLQSVVASGVTEDGQAYLSFRVDSDDGSFTVTHPTNGISDPIGSLTSIEVDDLDSLSCDNMNENKRYWGDSSNLRPQGNDIVGDSPAGFDDTGLGAECAGQSQGASNRCLRMTLANADPTPSYAFVGTTGAGTIEFKAFADFPEASTWKCELWIDGTLRHGWGEQALTTVTTDVTAGTHTFAFIFRNTGGSARGAEVCTVSSLFIP